MPNGHDSAAVADALARLSAAWRGRRYDELAALLDERIVLALPGLAGRVEGRDALVESYREFMDRATITAYREDPPAIDVWGDTAVATFGWEIAWLAGGVPNHATGRDTFVLHRTHGGPWIAVWRTMAYDQPSG